MSDPPLEKPKKVGTKCVDEKCQVREPQILGGGGGFLRRVVQLT